MENVEIALCPMFQKICDDEACPLWLMFDGDQCPIALDPDALEAIKTAFRAAAVYLDSVLGLEPDEPGSIVAKVRKSLGEGKINWRQIAKDVADIL